MNWEGLQKEQVEGERNTKRVRKVMLQVRSDHQPHPELQRTSLLLKESDLSVVRGLGPKLWSVWALLFYRPLV